MGMIHVFNSCMLQNLTLLQRWTYCRIRHEIYMSGQANDVRRDLHESCMIACKCICCSAILVHDGLTGTAYQRIPAMYVYVGGMAKKFVIES